jgi:predicted esterase
MTREDRLAEIDDYVRWLDAALDAATGGFDPARARLHVLGFSQGAVTATRWLHARHVRGLPPAARLVLWGGSVPHDMDLAADGDVLRRAPLTMVAGDDDQFATPVVVAEQAARLDAAAVPYTVVRYAGGHRLDGPTLAALIG